MYFYFLGVGGTPVGFSKSSSEHSLAFSLPNFSSEWPSPTVSTYPQPCNAICCPLNFLLEDHQWWLAQFCFYSISFAKSQKPQEFWIFLAALNALLPEIPWHQSILNAYFFSAALLFLQLSSLSTQTFTIVPQGWVCQPETAKQPLMFGNWLDTSK